MVVSPFDTIPQVYREWRMLTYLEGPICSSCRHRGELPGSKLPLGEGYLADSTHLLVIILGVLAMLSYAIPNVTIIVPRG